MVAMINLNTTEGDETTKSSESLSSVSALSASNNNNIHSNATTSVLGSSNGTTGSSVCLELWHACAGQLIFFPKKGSVTVYFPLGHLEQLPGFPLASFDLPSHVFCRVVDVKLHAEASNDDLYAQVLLVPIFLRMSKLNKS